MSVAAGLRAGRGRLIVIAAILSAAGLIRVLERHVPTPRPGCAGDTASRASVRAAEVAWRGVRGDRRVAAPQRESARLAALRLGVVTSSLSLPARDVDGAMGLAILTALAHCGSEP